MMKMERDGAGPNYRDLAKQCRNHADAAWTAEAKQALLEMAIEYDRKADRKLRATLGL